MSEQQPWPNPVGPHWRGRKEGATNDLRLEMPDAPILIPHECSADDTAPSTVPAQVAPVHRQTIEEARRLLRTPGAGGGDVAARMVLVLEGVGQSIRAFLDTTKQRAEFAVGHAGALEGEVTESDASVGFRLGSAVVEGLIAGIERHPVIDSEIVPKRLQLTEGARG